MVASEGENGFTDARQMVEVEGRRSMGARRPTDAPEAPQAQYLPRCAPGPTSREVVPLDEDHRRFRYPDDTDHEQLWNRAVSRLVEDRFLLPEDADDLRAHRTPQP
jgi:hypothetical protein